MGVGVGAGSAAAGAGTGLAKSLDPKEVDSFLAIHADGSIALYTSRVDVGTGLRIAMTQMAAEELGVNLILGGHYATETFGVKALATHLSERFGLAWEFIGCPTGL